MSETITASATTYMDKHAGFSLLKHEVLGGSGSADGKMVKKFVKRYVEYIKKSVEKQPHLER